ncbi:conserved exported protein of unknown function [Candidatus Nitrosocosmicus franklandus]|uniref:Uncharacterized protein n=2 Tax=Candidatus Nitrosocosmicus franklandianus TaxID=1798806 RepID=A0A484IEJ0_9ARCH|nr:conserved exported protein of unknown function [Candidatus Nitrosocosmicus franklandus]
MFLFRVIFSLLVLVSSILLLMSIPADAHFTHISYYNSESMGIGDKYFIDQELNPEYAKPNEQTYIMFSIQDKNGNDVYNVNVMVEIYSAAGELIHTFPWTNLAIGDFEIPYIFEKNGNYQVVLSILNEGMARPTETDPVPPTRTILTDNANCNCERAIFNLAISETFGFIYTLAFYGIIISAIVVFGVVSIWILLKRRKNKRYFI